MKRENIDKEVAGGNSVPLNCSACVGQKEFSYYYITENSNKTLFFVGIYHEIPNYQGHNFSSGGIIAANFQTFEKAASYIEKCFRYKRKFGFRVTPIKNFICFRISR